MSSIKNFIAILASICVFASLSSLVLAKKIKFDIIFDQSISNYNKISTMNNTVSFDEHDTVRSIVDWAKIERQVVDTITVVCNGIALDKRATLASLESRLEKCSYLYIAKQHLGC